MIPTNNMFFILIFLIITIFLLYKPLYKRLYSIKVKSNIDGKYYTVRDSVIKQESADTLATINVKILQLLDYIRTQPDDGNGNVKLLLQRYNQNNLVENIDLDNTSYTLNKGDEIAMCISTRDNVHVSDQIYDINKLMFVAIHELSHVGCKSDGHNQEFVSFFTYLLKKAMEINIYQYENYSQQPTEYCGMTIDSTPLN